MNDPKSNKDMSDKVRPAPYADAAVNDEDLGLPKDKSNLSEDTDIEDDEHFDEVEETDDKDSLEEPEEIEEIEIEEIEIEDIDDLHESAELDGDLEE